MAVDPVLVIVSLMWTAAAAADVYMDYCNIRCNGMHTVCKRASARCKPVARCNYMGRPPLMTDKLRDLIVTRHNELRGQVARGELAGQPSAANMNALNYNFELEFIAQCWANTCTFAHDQCRHTRTMRSGQNIAYAWSSRDDTRDAAATVDHIANWFGEHTALSPAEVDAFKGAPGAGHYTQLVWANIEFVGCGKSAYVQDGLFHVLLVCNYAGPHTGGNLLGAPIYEKGAPATKCPSGRRSGSVSSGLCGEQLSLDQIERFNHVSHLHYNTSALLILSLYYIITLVFI